MPDWLKVLALINPLTYAVDGLRALMPAGGTSSYGVGTDLGVLILVSAALIALGSRLYPQVAR
jgi:ABC-2 type transport system permease protein